MIIANMLSEGAVNKPSTSLFMLFTLTYLIYTNLA